MFVLYLGKRNFAMVAEFKDKAFNFVKKNGS